MKPNQKAVYLINVLKSCETKAQFDVAKKWTDRQLDRMKPPYYHEWGVGTKKEMKLIHEFKLIDKAVQSGIARKRQQHEENWRSWKPETRSSVPHEIVIRKSY